MTSKKQDGLKVLVKKGLDPKEALRRLFQVQPNPPESIVKWLTNYEPGRPAITQSKKKVREEKQEKWTRKKPRKEDEVSTEGLHPKAKKNSDDYDYEKHKRKKRFQENN